MQEYSSDKVQISKGIEEVFSFLEVPGNYESLMPPSVTAFKAGEKNAEISIQGLGTIDLGFAELHRPHKILIRPQNKVPFPFHIEWVLESNAQGTAVQAFIHAELNFMMRMMADKLLKGFLDTQVQRLAEHMNHD